MARFGTFRKVYIAASTDEDRFSRFGKDATRLARKRTKNRNCFSDPRVGIVTLRSIPDRTPSKRKTSVSKFFERHGNFGCVSPIVVTGALVVVAWLWFYSTLAGKPRGLAAGKVFGFHKNPSGVNSSNLAVCWDDFQAKVLASVVPRHFVDPEPDFSFSPFERDLVVPKNSTV